MIIKIYLKEPLTIWNFYSNEPWFYIDGFKNNYFTLVGLFFLFCL